MKKKIFTLFLGALLVGSVFGQQPSAVIKKATTNPVIDGVVDEVWAIAEKNNIDVPMVGEVPTLGASGETTWQALWGTDGIYVLLQVTDDAFYPNYAAGAANSWEYDKPEIYFDVNFVLADAMGPSTAGSGHYQVAPGFVDGENAGTVKTDATSGVMNAFFVTEPNYIAEYFVPFSWLLDKDGLGVDKTGNIGFDVTIIDREASNDTRRRAVWANDGSVGESWSNMDACGIITLEGAEAGVYIDGITLEGGSITEDNGTLQMVPVITPEDATNKVLKWTVTNETGKATVDKNGLVTAVANGDVTVTAAATDGSYEEASATVTITGQVTTLWELNIIKNGTFDMVEPTGTATYWGGWGGDAGSPMPQVIDGVAVATPVAAADVWQYQFSQSGLTALPDVDYKFQMRIWAAADRNVTVDFEDTPGNNYNRYGVSTDVESTGRSEWAWDITTVPTVYTFNVNFDQMVETTVQKVQYMLATTGDIVYIDSILLVTAEEYMTVAVPEQFAASKVKVYPNPANGSNMITVLLPANSSRITIYDSVGRQVEEVKATSDRAIINVSSYARGMYFVKVDNEKVVKFIK